MNKAICAVWLLSMTVWAAPEPSSTPDYCDDPADWKTMDGLLQSAPGDELVIKLYALRLGLCQMIKDKNIDTQAGIDLFESERQRAMTGCRHGATYYGSDVTSDMISVIARLMAS